MLKRKIIFSVIGVCSVFAVSIGFGVYTKISAQAPEKVDYVCYQGDISALEGVSFNMVVKDENYLLKETENGYMQFEETFSNTISNYSFSLKDGKPVYTHTIDNILFDYKNNEDSEDDENYDQYTYCNEENVVISSQFEYPNQEGAYVVSGNLVKGYMNMNDQKEEIITFSDDSQLINVHYDDFDYEYGIANMAQNAELEIINHSYKFEIDKKTYFAVTTPVLDFPSVYEDQGLADNIYREDIEAQLKEELGDIGQSVAKYTIKSGIWEIDENGKFNYVLPMESTSENGIKVLKMFEHNNRLILYYLNDRGFYACIYNPKNGDRKDILIAEGNLCYDNIKLYYELSQEYSHFFDIFENSSAEAQGRISCLITDSEIVFFYNNYEKNTNHIIAVNLNGDTEVLYDYEVDGNFERHNSELYIDWYDYDNYRNFIVRGDRIYFYSLVGSHLKYSDVSVFVTVIEKDKILFEGILSTEILDSSGEKIDSENQTIDFSLENNGSAINQYHEIISLDMTLAE